MGRRRRRVVRFPKKRLPTVFLCPKCGKETVHVTIDRVNKSARVECGSCQLKADVSVSPASAQIDAYCRFVDSYYSQPASQ